MSEPVVLIISRRAASIERGWIRRERPDGNRREVHAVLAEAGSDLLRAAARAT